MIDQPKTRNQWDDDVFQFATAQEWADGETSRLDDEIARLTERKRAIKEVRERIESRVKEAVKAEYEATGEMPHPRFEARTLSEVRYDRSAVLEVIAKQVDDQESKIDHVVAQLCVGLPDFMDSSSDEIVRVIVGQRPLTGFPISALFEMAHAFETRETDPYAQSLRIKRELDAKKFKANWNLNLLPDVPAVLETETIIALTQRDMSDLTAQPDRSAMQTLITQLNEQLEARLQERAEERAAELLPTDGE